MEELDAILGVCMQYRGNIFLLIVTLSALWKGLEFFQRNSQPYSFVYIPIFLIWFGLLAGYGNNVQKWVGTYTALQKESLDSLELSQGVLIREEYRSRGSLRNTVRYKIDEPYKLGVDGILQMMTQRYLNCELLGYPEERRLQPYVGRSVKVWHRGSHLYQMTCEGNLVFRLEDSNQRVWLHNLFRLFLLNITLALMVLSILLFVIGYCIGDTPTKQCARCGEALEEPGGCFAGRQFRFCRHCGKDSTPGLPITAPKPERCYGTAIMAFLLMFLTVLFFAEIAKNGYPLQAIAVFLMILLTACVLYLLRIELCPQCGASCLPTDEYCFHCGQQFHR